MHSFRVAGDSTFGFAENVHRPRSGHPYGEMSEDAVGQIGADLLLFIGGGQYLSVSAM